MKYKQDQPKVKHVGFHNIFHTKNKLGLDKAYASDNKVYISGDTAFIAGTVSWQDVFNDWVKVPLGLTRYSQRYQDADSVLKKNPQVNKLVGHSLGSVVSDESAKRNKDE